MEIYPPTGVVGTSETITARLRVGTVSSPRPSVWPLIFPVGASPVLETPGTNYPPQEGLGAPAEPGRFGDLTINSDWGWQYDSPVDMLSSLVRNQGAPEGYFFYQSGEPVNQGTWEPAKFAEFTQYMAPAGAAATDPTGGPGISVVSSKVSLDRAATSGLAFDAVGDAGKVRVDVEADRGLALTANGLGIDVAGAVKGDIPYFDGSDIVVGQPVLGA